MYTRLLFHTPYLHSIEGGKKNPTFYLFNSVMYGEEQ